MDLAGRRRRRRRAKHQAKKTAYSFSFFPLLLFLPPFPLFLGMLAVVVDFRVSAAGVWLRCVNWVLIARKRREDKNPATAAWSG